jgi:hypothetical protein
MNNISLESLVQHSLSQLAVGCVFALWLLNWVEHRRMASLSKLLLAVFAFGSCIRLVTISDNFVQRAAWSIYAVFVAVLTLIAINQWRSLGPSQVYVESTQVSPKKLKKNHSLTSHSQAWSPTSWLALLSTLLGLAVLGYSQFPELNELRFSIQLLAMFQSVGTTLLTGISLFLCLELTLISSPDALNVVEPTSRVDWLGVSRLTMAVALSILACCLAQFWLGSGKSVGEINDSALQLAARFFGLLLLISTFVVWMVPQRLATCQRKNHSPSDWVSLTLTAWLGLMAFAVAAALPADWPWSTLVR